MSIPRMSSFLVARKCKTKDTQSDSFANIMADVQNYSKEKDKTTKMDEDILTVGKKSTFVEEGLAWNKWHETSRLLLLDTGT